MTVVAIGPGIGRNLETVHFVRQAVRQIKIPLVIDADGLNAFEGETQLLNGRPASAGTHPAPGRDVAPGEHLHQTGCKPTG